MNKKNIPVIVRLKQNNNDIIQGINKDDAGVLFDITIMDGLEPFDYSGYSVVVLKIKKPDGTFRYDSGDSINVDTVDTEHGRIKLNIPTSCTNQDGMYFCNVGFGHDEETYFETMSFNYYVGENPGAEDDTVIGTNEFPILNNLIAQVSGAVSAEELRVASEANRESAETSRQTEYSTMVATLTGYLAELEDRLVNAETMLQEVYEAIAEGGSIDVSQITALATKTYVNNKVKGLNFGTASSDAGHLQIFHDYLQSARTLRDGELFYAVDTNDLYVGYQAENHRINEPCFVISAEEPTDTEKLWIDVSSDTPVIRFYDGSDWTSCNTAVFA